MNNERYLEHHGILGQKWGVRRYQNPDGSLTAAGQKRYSKNEEKKTQMEDRATRYGGNITSNGKYKASNGVVIAESKNKAIAGMRKLSTSVVGRGLSAAGRASMARATGKSTEDLKAQEKREREALKEYYKVGGDKMLNKYGKLSIKNISEKNIANAKTVVNSIIGDYEDTAEKVRKQGGHTLVNTKTQNDEIMSKMPKKTSSYNPRVEENISSQGFKKYVKEQLGGFDQVDDFELLELVRMEYESTGKSSYKTP